MDNITTKQPRLKLRKGAAEERIKTMIESKGGIFLSINWKKNKVAKHNFSTLRRNPVCTTSIGLLKE